MKQELVRTINKMDLAELIELAEETSKLIDSKKAGTKKAKRAEILAMVKDSGFDLRELGLRMTKEARNDMAAYVNPENPEETWTGKGRKPKWLTDALEAGADLDDFAVERKEAA